MLKNDWELGHIGLVVRDWNVALGYYQTTGMGISVGPQVFGMDYQDGEPTKFFYNNKLPRLNGGSGQGKSQKVESKPEEVTEEMRKEIEERMRNDTYKFLDKDCQVGDLLLEILQDKRIPFEGITHLCYNVPDVDAETEKLLKKGCETILSFTQGDTVLENYIDTRECGHVIISFKPPVRNYEKVWTNHNHSHPMLKDWKFHGIGIGVRDLDKIVEYYELLDIADFQAETELDSSSLNPINIPGYTPKSKIKARARVGQVGPVAFEFLQPLEGATIYNESLDSRGEGITDLAFSVVNLEEESVALVNKGIPLVLSGKPENGPAFAYFDTRENSGNIMIRLIQRD
jgi:catechol 2,3-dioxygenase-like lactoylglutathione lyase family enzyme